MRLVAQSCLTLCNPVGYSLPGSSVHGLYQARILEWVAISFSRASSQPRVEPTSLACPALAGGSFTHVSCMSCTGRGILYPRLLRALHWQGILYPRLLRALHWQGDHLPLVPPGRPVCTSTFSLYLCQSRWESLHVHWSVPLALCARCVVPGLPRGVNLLFSFNT